MIWDEFFRPLALGFGPFILVNLIYFVYRSLTYNPKD